MWKTLLSALILSGLLMLVRDASAANYNFVNIADSRRTFDSFQFQPQAVSDTGTVAFVGFQGGVPGTYVGDGTLTKSIAPNIQPPAGFSHYGYWVLNESGVAVDKVEQSSGPRHGKIQLHEATGTQTIFELVSDETFEHYIDFPAINNSGTVAFSINSATSFDLQDFSGSILRWIDETSTIVLDVTQGFNLALGVGLNKLGDVAFQGYREGDGYSFHRADGTTLTQIADSSGPLNIALGGVWDASLTRTAINDSGAVAFWSALDSGGTGIFVGDGGPLTTVVIADATTPFYSHGLGLEVAINNQGTVAFFGTLWDGRRGIFTGPDPVNDKVVAHGDFLFGQFVTGLGRPRLNERGDMAFWYEVRDFNEPEGYRTGIALAVKQSPEPGDFNDDGTVDAADYVVWRKSDGTQAGYDTWRARFGQTAGSEASRHDVQPSSAGVPEQNTIGLFAIAGIVSAAIGFGTRRRLQ